MSLDEIKAFIEINRHLPEVPSAEDMANDGLALKEMNILLLKKVEELTLHMIEKDEEIEALKNQSALLFEKFQEIEAKLD